MPSYNAADYLDKATVLAACDKIDEYAKDYYTMSREMDTAADGLNKEVLSIEGNSLDELIKEQAQYIRDFEGKANEFTESIRASVNLAYDNIQQQLDEQKAADEAAKAAEEASSSSNN